MRHWGPVVGSNCTAVIPCAGTGTEMITAINYGFNVLGVDSAKGMFKASAERLQKAVEVQKNRLALATLQVNEPEDYIKAAPLKLPDLQLTSPEKRRRVVFQKSNLSGLDTLYFGVLGIELPPGTKKPVLLETALKLDIM